MEVSNWQSSCQDSHHLRNQVRGILLLHLHAQEERGRRTDRHDRHLHLAVGGTLKDERKPLGRKRRFVQFHDFQGLMMIPRCA